VLQGSEGIYNNFVAFFFVAILPYQMVTGDKCLILRLLITADVTPKRCLFRQL